MLLLLIWGNLLGVLLEVLLLLPGRSVSVLRGIVEVWTLSGLLLGGSIATTDIFPIYGYIDSGSTG